jgi:hypothetical protein
VSVPRRISILIAVVAIAAGCEVSTVVEIGVNRDGSGLVSVEVTLDPVAADDLGDVDTSIQFADLEAGGWDVSPPKFTDAGVTIAGSKPFGSPDGLQSILDEIGGVDGVFRGWQIAIEDSFSELSWSVEGDVVLSGSITEFSDPELAAVLDGLPLARTAEELTAEMVDATFPFEVEVSLPQSIDSTNGARDPNRPNVAKWSYDLVGESVDDSLAATALETDRSPLRLMLVGGLMVVAALVLLVIVRLTRSRQRSDDSLPNNASASAEPGADRSDAI